MTTEACYTCQAEAYRSEHGTYESEHAQRHSWMWGCTCLYEAQAEAEFYMNVVTR